MGKMNKTITVVEINVIIALMAILATLLIPKAVHSIEDKQDNRRMEKFSQIYKAGHIGVDKYLKEGNDLRSESLGDGYIIVGEGFSGELLNNISMYIPEDNKFTIVDEFLFIQDSEIVGTRNDFNKNTWHMRIEFDKAGEVTDIHIANDGYTSTNGSMPKMVDDIMFVSR